MKRKICQPSVSDIGEDVSVAGTMVNSKSDLLFDLGEDKEEDVSGLQAPLIDLKEFVSTPKLLTMTHLLK